MNDEELSDYYSAFCEQAIWFQKIIHSNSKHLITVKEIAGIVIAERNRIMSYCPVEKQRKLKKMFNKIAAGYYFKVAHWSREQKTTKNMV